MAVILLLFLGYFCFWNNEF